MLVSFSMGCGIRYQNKLKSSLGQKDCFSIKQANAKYMKAGVYAIYPRYNRVGDSK